MRANKDLCDVLMPSEDTKILEFNQYQKSDKIPFIIYEDLKSLIWKSDVHENNPEKLSTAKVEKHILPSVSISIMSFKDRK